MRNLLISCLLLSESVSFATAELRGLRRKVDAPALREKVDDAQFWQRLLQTTNSVRK